MIGNNWMDVQYEYLTAEQCDALKKEVEKKLHTYTWGTFGDRGDEELDHHGLDQLSSQHLENILITQPQISNELACAVLLTLKKRWRVL